MKTITVKLKNGYSHVFKATHMINREGLLVWVDKDNNYVFFCCPSAFESASMAGKVISKPPF